MSDCIVGYHHGCQDPNEPTDYSVYSKPIDLDDPDEDSPNNLARLVLFWVCICICIAVVSALKKATEVHNDPVNVMNRRGENFEQFMDR